MPDYLEVEEAKRHICAVGQKMYAKGFVAANDGNITLRVGEDRVVATPTGVSKGAMTPEMLITVDLEGKLVAGDYKPTSELPMHLAAYRNNAALRSTCHSHSPYLTAFAIAGLALDIPYSPETVFITGSVPIAPFAIPGSPELAQSIVPFVHDYNLVLLANHGPMSWGGDANAAWFVMESAESYAKLCLILRFMVGRSRPLMASQIQEQVERFHLDASKAGHMAYSEEPCNQEPALALSDYHGPFLSDLDVERIATRVAEKLAGNK
ncbi:MAG: class II aldolase/adducin family protein [Planctomycetota bacterium]|jgi:L-fuculose-phosphate aldolase|nr:class II aldolase/adducin family protein [Planctomycetota bacterium]